MCMFSGVIPLLIALLALSFPAQTIEGKWYTTSRAALKAATKAKMPVLAVAMDHG